MMCGWHNNIHTAGAADPQRWILPCINGWWVHCVLLSCKPAPSSQVKGPACKTIYISWQPSAGLGIGESMQGERERHLYNDAKSSERDNGFISLEGESMLNPQLSSSPLVFATHCVETE